MDIVSSPCESFDLQIESWRANTIAFRSLQGRIGVALSMLRSALLVAACLLAAIPAAAGDLRVVAYALGWDATAQGCVNAVGAGCAGAALSAIDPTRLTHINFAFGKIAGGKAVLPHPGVAGNLADLRSLKARNPQLKVLLSVGGWEADGFSDAALTAESRDVFAASIVALLREHSLDGVDIDWEYPGQSVAGIKSRPQDKQNFTALLQTLRAHLGSRYLLTIASADHEYFDFTEMDRLHVYLDFINVMTYDFFNALTPTTGHHAGLYASPYAAPTDRNADASIKQHLAAGIPPDKLVLGVAFYGRGFAGVKPEHHGVNQAYERFEAAHPYAELVQKFIGRNGFVRKWDRQAQAPFLWNASTRAFITYDDPQSIAIKAEYVRKHRLGGMMFWELSQDSRGELLDAIVNGLKPEKLSPRRQDRQGEQVI
jgi:chitinase